MDTTDPTPMAEETLAILRAVEELGEHDDAGEVMRRGLRLARTLTGADAGLLAIDDDTRPGWLAQVLTEGVHEDDPLAVSLLEGRPEDSEGGPVLRGQIRVGGQEFGTLHLARWPRPPGPRERAVVRGIAVAMGPRIETLRQRRVSELHERVTQTVWELNRTLVEQVDLEVTLPLLAQRVLELTSAEAVALVGTRSEGAHRVLAASGDDAGAVLADLAPDLTEVMAAGVAHHWSATPAGDQLSSDRRVCTSLVPVDTRAGEVVVLAVHRWKPSRGVSQQQVRDVLSALALHASVILDREQGEREHDLLTLLQDRDRIARDLHDLVIQRLFAVGLTLQGASRRAVNPEVVERLEGAVGELDQTIRDIRATIFELRHRAGAGSFRADLRQLIESYAPTLGFAPVVHLVGPLDAVTDDEVQTQVLMVVREALSNVARHAGAGSVTVEVEATAEQLSVVVRDDGVGIGADAVESGLGNVRARAAEHGGAVELSRGEPHGTVLRWSVPV
ncbi:sensor histidine kinase [Ornithinimicrobium pekingense]|uniref:Histidine kinase n=1 Tax=Ornithinimicrobium pekingense TaxID=384677 RepID=A0ABQ2FFF3_9MICO|nr:histidine kinase [Ornithinimicrobium pekingense]GGK82499.1 histidine kinase [Ornithinimicrobium pekingense]